MTTEHAIAAHYLHGNLEQALLDGLVAAGKNPDQLTPSDLHGADEFHIGGAEATDALAAQFTLSPASTLLDLGSGIGGPARHLAAAHGCQVTGIELSAEYVAVAESLTSRMGLGGRVSFRQGSALDLPFPDASFDVATLLHVGMNIADKPALCAAVARVLRPGGVFAIYDVMRSGPGDLLFPLPWASAAETSFVAPAAEYRAALEIAGFRIEAERERSGFAREFFAAQRARQAQAALQPGPSPLGLQVIMGANARQKIANLVGLLEAGIVAPSEIIARR